MKGFKPKGKSKGGKRGFGGFFAGLDSLIGIEEPHYNLTEEDVEELIKLINEPMDD